MPDNLNYAAIQTNTSEGPVGYQTQPATSRAIFPTLHFNLMNVLMTLIATFGRSHLRVGSQLVQINSARVSVHFKSSNIGQKRSQAYLIQRVWDKL